jgi:hypothetical protein
VLPAAPKLRCAFLSSRSSTEFLYSDVVATRRREWDKCSEVGEVAIALVSGGQFTGNDFGRMFEGRAWTWVCGHDCGVIFSKSALDMLTTDLPPRASRGSPSATSPRSRPRTFQIHHHRRMSAIHVKINGLLGCHRCCAIAGTKGSSYG